MAHARDAGTAHGPWLARRVGVMACALTAGVALAACGSSTESSGPTTTTSASPTTSAACEPHPAKASSGATTMTVTPGTCLRNGTTVTITGSGFAPNSPGGLAECSGASGQPTISVAGSQVPVSCTNPLAQPVSTASTGALATTFTIATGVVGPPAQGADSTGGQASASARSYPCPPTSAQAAAGATCTISFGNAAGDQVSVPIEFAPGT